MPALDYRAARDQVRVAEVLTLLGWQPQQRAGDQVRGPCPLHGSRSPASRCFVANLRRQLFHCFTCGAGGNALDLWAAHTRLPLHAAVLDLFDRLHRPAPWLAANQRRQPP
jgi:DNA primase